MHRLTEPEYRMSVMQLLGVSVEERLPGDYRLHGLTSVGAAELSIAPADLERYETAAWGVAERAFPGKAAVLSRFGCEVDASDAQESDACVAPFALDLAHRAWRRPVADHELDDLVALFQGVREQTGDEVLASRAIVAAVLQSPWFLFRVEIGVPDASDPAVRWLTDHELAARMAAFLTGGLPDDALLADADAGLLSDPDVLRGHVHRLLEGPGAHAAFARFATEILDLDRIATVDKDPELYPFMTPELRASMRSELEALFVDTTLVRDAPIGEILTSNRAYLSPSLAAHYGVAEVGEDGWAELPPEQARGGLLGRAGYLSLHAHASATSPTRRGLVAQTRLLCGTVPPPPEGVDTNLPPPDASRPQTTRERLTQHREDPACNGCHLLMDPMGLALEKYDPVGAYRTEELGLPIDASFEIGRTTGDGAAELGVAIAEDPRFAACMVRQLYRHGIGQHESDEEEEDLLELIGAFDDRGQQLRAFLVTFILHPSFRQVSPPDRHLCDEEGAVRACASACGEGEQVCDGGVWRGCSTPTAIPEICNGIDDDCDGEVDEVVRTCDAEYREGVQTCDEGAWSGPCVGPPTPDEVCNGIDDNENGAVDEGLDIDRLVVSFDEVAAAHPGCDLSSDAQAGACRAAIKRTCGASDCSTTGFGPVGLDLGNREATLGCLDASRARTFTTSYTELRAQHPGCSGTSDTATRWGSNCNAAVSRWCAAQGQTTGFGPVENSGDIAAVVCTPGATVVRSTYTEVAPNSDPALGRCDGTEARIGAPCDAAFHADCRSRGFETGYGPVENYYDNVVFVCLGEGGER